MSDAPEEVLPRGAFVKEAGEEDFVPVVVSEPTQAQAEVEQKIPEELPVLPIRDTVTFPGTVIQLQVHRVKSKKVLDLALGGDRMIAVVTQRSSATEDPGPDDLHKVGTACAILKKFKHSDGSESIVVHGVVRVDVLEVRSTDKYLLAKVRPRFDQPPATTELKALVHSVRQIAGQIIKLSTNIPEEARIVLESISEPGQLADFLAANLPLGVVHKQEILESFDVTARLKQVHLAAAAQLEVVELSNKIQEQVNQQVDRSQREYYLREQMKAIQKELGEAKGEAAAIATFRERIAAARMPAAVEAEALKEVDRLAVIPAISPEYSMTTDYIDWLVSLPWSFTTEDRLDLKLAERVLDEDHYGLEKVKRRILEFLAVRQLRKEARGPILCFTGPPGVGKTSLGQSIARAMGRTFIRVSLGGIRDEASIRGHRRTYIGSMPGRIIREIRRAGSNNPVFMLDEVDKISRDVHGDPMAALLEVLDPAQNSTFTDHYLGVPFDLSRVFFIGTANYVAAIERALRDRMEIIEIPGYTIHEKLMIAKQHLLPRQIRENGLTPDTLRLDDALILTLISEYTREAGVRSLERQLGAICRSRAAAVVRGEAPAAEVTRESVRAVLGPPPFETELALTQGQPGIVTGLAFTPTGGEILFIEATKMPGRGHLMMTGQLGEVMRESAQAAASIIRARTDRWTVKPEDYSKLDLHIHVPGGAIPKDGPSAGLAILTAMTSILLGCPVDPSVGMTGEITLSGRILPVGGIREKVLAAHLAGLKTVILPARNEPNLEDISSEIRSELRFIFANTIDEVLPFIFPACKEAPTKVERPPSKVIKVKDKKATPAPGRGKAPRPEEAGRDARGRQKQASSAGRAARGSRS